MQKLVLKEVDLVSTGVTQLILEEMSGFAMMAGKWLTRLCTTGTECPDDRPDDSR